MITTTTRSICNDDDRIERVQEVEIVELNNISIEVDVFNNTNLITCNSFSELMYIVAIVVLITKLLRQLRRRQ